jgi:hypothetical protein
MAKGRSLLQRRLLRNTGYTCESHQERLDPGVAEAERRERGPNARDRLLAIFGVFSEWFSRPGTSW